ncbi:MAG: AAA domain-containing protein [Spirochaetales bacterium]|nr:AAA domain-containing protein [Spirochaetales bacterium]
MHERFLRLISVLSADLPEREQAVALGILAVAAGESLFLLGPPGVAKSLLARRLKFVFRQARSFEYLMGKFSTPEEIFGPLSISGLRDRDVFERKTQGYLPQSDVVFLDELWRAGPPIQNTLLAILNEKVFRNGGQEEEVPLKLLIGASNRTPDGEENAEAFWDRFLIRVELHPLSSGPAFQKMLADTNDLYHPQPQADDQLGEQEWFDIQKAVATVEIPPMILETLDALRDEAAKTIYVSDRRWKKSVRLLKAAALLHDRKKIDPLDLAVLEHVLWQKPAEREAVEGLVLKALEDFGWPAPFEVDILLQKIQALRDELQGLTRRSKIVTQPKPVLYDGEYYAVVGYPDPLSARVWAQDYALWSSEREVEGEVFFFRPMGAYVSSRKLSLRRGEGPAEIVIDGVLYALESVPEELTVWTRVIPKGSELKEWSVKAEAVLQELEEGSVALESFLAQKLTDAAGHLFADSRHAQACQSELKWQSARLGDAKTGLIELMETRNPELLGDL